MHPFFQKKHTSMQDLVGHGEQMRLTGLKAHPDLWVCQLTAVFSASAEAGGL